MDSDMLFSASTELSELLKPTGVGDRVNVHVVDFIPQPYPDFDAMRRTLIGSAQKADETRSSEPIIVVK